MALAAYRARPESLERCSQLSWFPFRSVDTREHTDLAVPDEERCCDEAQDQRPQQHGVTELEEPHTQQTTHLDQVESGHLKKTHTHTHSRSVFGDDDVSFSLDWQNWTLDTDWSDPAALYGFGQWGES